ncbi:MAG: ribulose-phosphate 3-epimerase [Candidatus Methanofastidiosum methylothiophilum]|uniref:Ribulose-phosphate 3-epimerase n=1 Tax=Candidatus Methanofastidiosum methylothiophilum TaxID=1705564 RepID=A0A150J1H8_9EURY|nr:MAG: ribulose-phosphate 3-epimerase [Candidatus Methanofastidiosum methylthiophilus]NMC77441.1 ribulose-phosphate 3-epimerase [Candidatus Methanofastidiosa archaeon]
MAKLAPSILSANFSRLGEDIKEAENAGADIIHMDVMDGHFVPNITIGPLVVEAVSKVTKLPLDVHLMIENPSDYVEMFFKSLESGKRNTSLDYISFHIEASYHPHRLLNKIKEFGVKSGIALNPSTPINTITHLLDSMDLLVLMTVNPGFGGQSFIESMLPKIKEAKELLKGHDIEILVDGGVTEKNIKKIRDAGADILVAGSSVFNERDSIKNNITRLKALV